MMQLKSFMAFAILATFSFLVKAQHNHQPIGTPCGTYDAEEYLFELHPELKQNAISESIKLESFNEKFAESFGKRAATYVIPIVFHIIHQNGPENISDAQVRDAVRILNEDYSGNSERNNAVINQFQGLIGTADIEFRLATIDPSGNPTNGIDRIVSSQTNQGNENSKIGGWPRSKYLNIWVCNAVNGSSGPGGVLAYAFKPGVAHGYPSGDGIIVKHPYVGTIGTSVDSEGATLTHEIGHFLNLDHTWGPTNQPGLSSNCNFDDNVGDTPPTVGQQGGCNTSFQSCGSLDNAQNFMEYTRCELMFTQGQVSRMHATLNSSTAQRSNLWKQTNLSATGVLGLRNAEFSVSKNIICEGESIDFKDQSYYQVTGWNWEFESGSPAISSSEDPQVTYSQGGLFKVKLSSSHSGNVETATKNNYIFVKSSQGKLFPFAEDFSDITSLPNSNWFMQEEASKPYKWSFVQNAGFNDNRSIVFKQYGNSGIVEDELHSASYDLTVMTSAKLSFKVAYQRRQNTDLDIMQIYVTNDCGENWKLLTTQVGPGLASVSGFSNTAFKPNGQGDWKDVEVNIPSEYYVKNAQFRFVFKGNKGNNCYLDNINIDGTFKNKTELVFPSDNAINVPVSETLIWKGLGNVSYEYEIDENLSLSSAAKISGVINTNTFSGNLPPNKTLYWRVRAIKNGVEQAWTDIWSFKTSSASSVLAPTEIENVKVYPNPISESSVIAFDLNESTEVSIRVADVTGRVITVIENEMFISGSHKVELPYDQFAKGLYHAVFQLNGKQKTVRFVK